MSIWSGNLKVDTGICALQGFVFSLNYNLRVQSLSGAAVLFNPIYGAVAGAGIALTTKLFDTVNEQVAVYPNWHVQLLFLALTPRKFVSMGLSTYTVFKVMHVVGLILTMPYFVQIIGLLSGAAFIAGAAVNVIKMTQRVKDHKEYCAWEGEESNKKRKVSSDLKKSDDYSVASSSKTRSELTDSRNVEQKFQKLFESPSLTQEIFSFQHEGKTYQIRVIANPELKEVCFRLLKNNEYYQIKYMVGCKDKIPESLEITLKEKFGDRPYYILSEANGMSAFEYTEGFTIAR